MGLHSEASLNHKFIEFAKQMNLYLNHFPKHEKYGLSQQIRNTAYDLYGLIIECQGRHYKKTSFNNMNICHERLRMFIHLAFELGYFGFKDGTQPVSSPEYMAYHRFSTLSTLNDELGRMIGGWIGYQYQQYQQQQHQEQQYQQQQYANFNGAINPNI